MRGARFRQFVAMATDTRGLSSVPQQVNYESRAFRVRNDDSGCEASPSCFNCPLGSCAWNESENRRLLQINREWGRITKREIKLWVKAGIEQRNEAIVQAWDNGDYPKDIALKFGITRQHVGHIVAKQAVRND